MSTSIQIPKKVIKEIFEAGRRFAVAEDALEDILLATNPQFIKKMCELRRVHQEGHMGSWDRLKTKHGL